jgi:hypothetical protein
VAQALGIAGILSGVRGVAVSVVAAVVIAGSASAATAPALRLHSLHPFVVNGVGFHARKRLRVTLVSPAITETRSTRTTAAGQFSVDFGTVMLGRCAGYTVRAIGPAGTATLKHTPLPACMP